MPYVDPQITRGATCARKAAIVRGFTEVLARVLHERPEHAHVAIREIVEQDRGVAGVLTDDRRRRQGEPGT